MLRLYLVRHGETKWNKEGRYISRTDIELSAEGLEQAAAIGSRLKNFEIDAIFCSPRKRAIQTAQAISEHGSVEPLVIEEFDEIDFGGWEGLTFREIEARHPGMVEQWIDDPSKTQIPDGESWDAFAERVGSALMRITQKRDEGAIAAVAHGGTIRAVLIRLLNLNPAIFAKVTVEHAALTAVDVHREWAFLRYLNDGCHLVDSHS